MQIKNWLSGLVLFSAFTSYGQEEQDTTKVKLRMSAYIESYYSFDPKKPSQHQKPAFTYSHHRNNEISVNLAMLKLAYQTDRVRSNLALAAGSYMNANYAAEEGIYKAIYEANVGYKISKDANLWIDAGIMPSHIGPESAIGIDNINLTRSLAADNSPYFETGVKLSYQNSDATWNIAVLAVNGWQRIQLPTQSTGLSFGHQIQYKPTESLLINSSSYMGKEGADSLRMFHDFYVQIDLNEGLRLIGLFDFAIQRRSQGMKKAKYWTAGLQAKYQFNNRLHLNGRLEYFKDKEGMILAATSTALKSLYGASAGFDLRLVDNLVWRVEYRYLQANSNAFYNRDTLSERRNNAYNTAITWRF